MRTSPLKPAPLVPIAGFLAGVTLAAVIAFPGIGAAVLAGLLCIWRAVESAPDAND